MVCTPQIKIFLTLLLISFILQKLYCFFYHLQIIVFIILFFYHFLLLKTLKSCFVGSVVEGLEHRACGRHGLGSEPARAMLWYPWERHFTELFFAWWSWQVLATFSHISIKLKKQNNLASQEAGRGNCLPYVLASPSLSCESGG